MSDEPVKIWEAFGPNYSDNSMVGPPSWGVFQGEKVVVIDWVDLIHPEFKDHLEGKRHPRAELREITAKAVTGEMVAELRSAQEAARTAGARLKTATGN